MYSIDALGVLCSQCGGCCHSIAAMSGDHFLVGFKPAGSSRISFNVYHSMFGKTHAPPELSDPATTRMRFMFAFDADGKSR